jgi:hypothetical protein
MLNRGWATASWEQRQQMTADHTYFELGTFYFLANDPSVPEKVRSTYNDYGLCADEFEQWGHMPPQLYIRISNRMVGDFVSGGGAAAAAVVRMRQSHHAPAAAHTYQRTHTEPLSCRS